MSPIWTIMRHEIDLAADQAIKKVHEMAVQAATDLGCLEEYKIEYYRQRTGYYIWQDFNKALIQAAFTSRRTLAEWMRNSSKE